MAIVQSRVKNGTLTFGGTLDPSGTVTGGTSFACQATNVRVTPSYDNDGDDLTTLCGDTVRAGKKETWTIAGTSVQDFDDPEGFLAYCYDNAMDTVAFVWQPNTVGAPTWSGTCILVALEEGGDVNSQLTADFEFDINGRPTRIYTEPAQTPAPAGAPSTPPTTGTAEDEAA